MLLLFANSGGSSTPVTIVVPNLLGMAYADAVTTLENLGLSPYANSSIFSDIYPMGQIAEQSPSAGIEVSVGEQVFLTISLGPNLTQYSLPKDRTVLVGKVNRKVVC